MNLVIRIVMALAAVITGWFVAQDTARFSVVQMVVSLLIISALVIMAAFWPSLLSWLRNPRKPDDRAES